MNQKDAKRILVHLACIQALADGKKIECRAKTVDGEPPGRWAENFDPSFSLHFEYRVKPEPKIEFVNLYYDEARRSSFGCVHTDIAMANKNARQTREAAYLVKITTAEGEKPKFEIIDR